MKYRSDITALRALAVMLVVFFHFDVGPLQAGFIGVDVFFVISGFLITRIITSGINRNTFSFSHFYASRAHRLIPALAVLLITIAIFGWFFVAPNEYGRLGQHITSTSLFTSNIQFSRETDYFNPGGTSLWLLHTWSLSVEWQFYLIYPLILISIHKVFGIRNSVKPFIVIALLSFLFAIYASHKNYDNTYYLLSTRAWELLAGALAAHIKPHNKLQKNSVAIIGYGLILFSALFITDQKNWPNLLTILPIVGTLLIIISNTALISDKIKSVHLLGLSSYSIYLWHWPIFIGLGFWDLDNTTWAFFGILLSCAIGIASYLIIEKNRKSVVTKNSNSVLLKYITATALIALVGLFISNSNGFQYRLNSSLLKQNITNNDLETATRKDGWCLNTIDKHNKIIANEENARCVLTKASHTYNALIFGDSFAGQWDPFWKTIGETLGWNITNLTTSFCLPSLHDDYPKNKNSEAYKQCLINRDILKNEYEHFNTIILGGHWSLAAESGHLEKTKELIQTLANKNRRIIIMASPTIFPVNITNDYKQSIFSGKKFNITNYNLSSDRLAENANASLKKLCEALNKCTFINREDLFNSPEITDRNIPYSSDGEHISTYGASQAATKFMLSDNFSTLTRVRG